MIKRYVLCVDQQPWLLHHHVEQLSTMSSMALHEWVRRVEVVPVARRTCQLGMFLQERASALHCSFVP
jgi:hypothetical protein